MARNHTHELAVGSLYTALRRLMDRKPFREISITELVEEAKVSRMAFYRNFQNKGDILIDHMEKMIQSYQQKCQGIENLTERELWIGFFREMKEDHILDYLRKAELVDLTLDLQKRCAEELYRSVLRWDMEDPKNRMLLYQRMGSMLGLQLYITDYPNEADEKQLADQILAIIAVDKPET